MAISWDVCRLRTGDGSITDDTSNRADGRPMRQHTESWQAIATDDTAGDKIGIRLDDQMAIEDNDDGFGNPIIPQPGKTVYYNPNNGKVFPFFVCRSASAQRDESRANRFEVSCQFEDMSGMRDPLDVIASPTNLDDADAFVVATGVQSQVTSWTQTAVTGDPETCTLPTGSLYSDPPVRQILHKQYVVSQIESTFTPDKFDERMFAVNSGSFTIDGTTYEKHELMITDINYDEVKMPIGDHSPPASSREFADTYIVQYTVEAKSWVLKGLSEADNGDLVDLRPGHASPRVRADTRFLDGSQNRQWANAFEGWGMEPLYLKEDGTPFSKSNQYGVPPYDLLILQEQLDFSFIRVP